MKTVVHIIPHAHWDREWYLPLEQHRARLLRQLDNVLDLLSQSPDYTYHLDGQMIAVEDYLKFRPERREQICRFCEEGRLHLGPWYVLQDEYLTSGEANVRNLQLGTKMAEQFGPVCRIGYLPDAFGNVSQMPQLFRQAGFAAAAFGRGVTMSDTGSDPVAHRLSHSEFDWESPDGSRIFSVFFSGWYNNAQEIPADPAEAKPYWDARLNRARAYAATEHLLFMNGSDHQPVQKDLNAALETARALYPEIEFRCSDFEQFVSCVKESMADTPESVSGELCGQESAGDNTLCNTASSRMPIKVKNRKTESMLALVAEPMLAMAMSSGYRFDADLLNEAWRLLIENHPHDSICGCGIDAVHSETVYRYEKSLQLSRLLIDQAAKDLTSHMPVPDGTKAAFAVFNPSAWDRKNTVSVTVGVDRIYGTRDAYAALADVPSEEYVLTDWEGNEIPALIEDLGVRFGFELPKDRFRKPYFERQYRITFAAEVPSTGYAVYALKPGKQEPQNDLSDGNNRMENPFVSVQIRSNGTFDLTDRRTGKIYKGLGLYEDVGDVGDEYIFRETIDGRITSDHAEASVECIERTAFRTAFRIRIVMNLPKSAGPELAASQQSMEPRLMRRIPRSTETIGVPIETTLSLEKDSPLLRLDIRIDNRASDHRIRMLFPTDLAGNVHLADSVFDVLERTDVPGPNWTNPSRCQRMQYFVAAQDGTDGLAVLNRGAYEYEVLSKRRQMAVTLLRCVGEMGDWGVFLTPGAQCLGTSEITLGVLPYTGDSFRMGGCREAIQFQTDLFGQQICSCEKSDTPLQSVVSSDGAVAVTACKPAENGNGWIIRGCNVTGNRTDWTLHIPADCHIYASNITEMKGECLSVDESGTVVIPMNRKEIKTVRIEIAR